MRFKKTLLLIFSILLTINIAACGNSPEGTSSNEVSSLESGSNSGEDEAKNTSIEVDEGLLTVDITLPSSFFEQSSEEEIITNAKDKGYLSTKINEDGSVTYTMTKAKRNEILDEMKDSIDESIDELLLGADKVESFIKVEYDKNFTKFDIYVDPEVYSDWDSFYSLQFYLLGAYYQTFEGVASDKLDVAVNFIDNQSGDLIESGSYRSWSENLTGSNSISDNTGGSDVKNESIEPKVLKLNETVTIGNIMEITLTDSEWVDSIVPSNTSGFYSYYDDEDGEKYFVIRGKLKNIGSEDLDIQWINESEIVLNGTYKFSASMELESNEGSDFYGSAKPLQTLNLVVYASVSDEAFEIWELVDVSMKILSSGEYINNFFDEDYPHEILTISFSK